MMRTKAVGALLMIFAAAVLLLFRQPSIDAKLAGIEPELNSKLKAREAQIDPAELIDLIYNFNTALQVMDVRDEADFNRFHIIDSTPVTINQIRDPKWVKQLPKQTVMVLVSNDEKRAVQAWKLLSAQGVNNLYILAGGVNYWLDLYDNKSKQKLENVSPKFDPDGNDMLRHRFAFALGAKHPAADPDPKEIPKREYTKKVKSIGRAPKKSGGCG